MASSFTKGFGNELAYAREWVQTTLMPGIRPELDVSAHPQVKNVIYEVLTPRQIKVICSILVTVDEVRLEQEAGPIRLRRKHQTRPDVIPKAVSQMDVVTIIPVPDHQLPIKKVNSFEVECDNPTNTVMRNRVITKAHLRFRLKYTAFATRETMGTTSRQATPALATGNPHFAKPVGR
ncbi:MAG: hypothetical protein ACM3ZQ_10685 [Bacillota bacterium]